MVNQRVKIAKRNFNGRPPPNYLLWEITHKCNLRCLHCALRGGKARRGELDTSEALLVCDQIAELGIPSVSLMGGEPLLRKDWMQIAERLVDRGISVGIVTNGFMFDEAVANFCVKAGLTQVCVSLDAATPQVHDKIRGVKGSYHRAINAIKIVNSMNIPYRTVITSINRYNISELEPLLELLIRETEGFTWIINQSSWSPECRAVSDFMAGYEGSVRIAQFINHNRPVWRGKLNISGTHALGYFSRRFKNLHDFKWEGCPAGTSAIGLRSNGDVTGCLILPDEFVEGNVMEQSLVRIWNSPDFFVVKRKFDLRKLRGGCRGCKFAVKCKAGCTNMAISTGGSVYEYPWCFYSNEVKKGKEN